MDGVLSRSLTLRPDEVRIAGEKDQRGVYELLLHAADEMAIFPVSEEKVFRAMQTGILSKERCGVIGVIEVEDKIIASIGIAISEAWYTHAQHCEEIWCYVHPEHRKAKDNHIKTLITWAKWWADQMGMPLIMSVISNHRTEGKVRLYRRMIPCWGAVFCYRGDVR